MSQLSSHLFAQLGSGKTVTGFILVLARIAPLFVLAPLFSSKQIPTLVRTSIALGLAIGLTGIGIHGQNVPTDPTYENPLGFFACSSQRANASLP